MAVKVEPGLDWLLSEAQLALAVYEERGYTESQFRDTDSRIRWWHFSLFPVLQPCDHEQATSLS